MVDETHNWKYYQYRERTDCREQGCFFQGSIPPAVQHEEEQFWRDFVVGNVLNAEREAA